MLPQFRLPDLGGGDRRHHGVDSQSGPGLHVQFLLVPLLNLSAIVIDWAAGSASSGASIRQRPSAR